MADDKGMYLQATATYTDGEGFGKMESAMTTAPVGVTMDNEGSVSIFPRQSVVGRMLTANLSDSDTPTDITWQWARSEDGMDDTWTDIEDATAVTYTPVEADVGNYLRAMASYNDGYSSGRTAEGVTAAKVIAEADAPVDMCIEPLGTLAESETVMGTWAMDCMSTERSGSYARYYTFTLVSDMQVEMNLTSATDPYLALRRRGRQRPGRMVTGWQ